jgi:ribosomal subunit interface protein
LANGLDQVKAEQGGAMTIKVTGKNIEAGEAFKTYALDKISTMLGKYIGQEISGHVRLEKERGRFHTDCSIRLRTGLVLETEGEGSDAYASADAAIEKLEKRVRRYKRRLKNHHNGRHSDWSGDEVTANDYVVSASHDEEDSETASNQPLVIAETERSIRELPVSEAVMQLDLAKQPFFIFRNAGHGGLNVVYKRPDGNIGWIDVKPEQAGRDLNSQAGGKETAAG